MRNSSMERIVSSQRRLDDETWELRLYVAGQTPKSVPA